MRLKRKYQWGCRGERKGVMVAKLESVEGLCRVETEEKVWGLLRTVSHPGVWDLSQVLTPDRTTTYTQKVANDLKAVRIPPLGSGNATAPTQGFWTSRKLSFQWWTQCYFAPLGHMSPKLPSNLK